MKSIVTDQAPAAIGPYSQAVLAGGLLFCSGQIPLNPATGELVSGDIRRETRQVMENLQGILKASGGHLGQVVRTTIYLVDMADFQAVNEVYGGYFPAEKPARSTVAVAALPKGARVEIDAVAVLER